MSLSDPIADLLTRIRNGQHARHVTISAPSSKLIESILNVLKTEGYIRDYSLEELRPKINAFKIELKYDQNGKAVIKQIDRVSKPGRRVYSSIKKLGKIYNGLGINIVSTPKGVMSDHEARLSNVGGEVLCQVF